MEVFGIKQLSKLFAKIEANGEGDQDTSDSDNEVENKTSQFHPGTIGSTKVAQINSNSATNLPKAQHSAPKADTNIWNEGSGIPDLVLPDVSNDPRKTPEVSISFQQTVKTEDVFLGMGFKTPGTASCEAINVTIKLPEETSEAKASDFQLDLKEQWIELRSSKYILIQPLPFPINTRAGTAKWVADKCELVLNLKIGERELDAFNF